MSERPVVVGLGEVLWDLLPSGSQLGGAPANFACHARALGADARLISRVGDDSLGREAIQRLADLGLPTGCIQTDPSRPTGTVGVEVDTSGQPRYQIHENVAWDAIEKNTATLAVVRDAHAICFGSLAQRCELSRSTLRSQVQVAPAGALRIFDVNLRPPYFSRPLIEESLKLASILKVNDTELPWLAKTFGLAGDDRSLIQQLAARFELRLLACTRGPHGSLLFSDGRWSDHPGQQVEVTDTVGAGDAFTAAMTMGLLAGWSLDEINERANEVAAFVCSRPGATPALPESIRSRFCRA